MMRVCVLFGVLCMPIVASAAFVDVPVTDESSRAIEYVQSIGVVQGYDDGRFRPSFPINRAELLKVLVAAKGIEPDSAKYARCFPDVTDQWYASYVCYAKSRGWIQGYPDGTFGPEKQVLFVEALKMLVNVREYPLAPDKESDLRGVDASTWFAPYLTTSLLLDVVSYEQVWGASSIPLQTPLKRGFTAQLLYRSLLAEGAIHLPLSVSACTFLPVFLEIKTFVDVVSPSKKHVFRQEFRGIGPEGESCVLASDGNPFARVTPSFDAYFLQPFPEGQLAHSWIVRVPIVNGRVILRPRAADGGSFRPEVFLLDLLGGELRQRPSIFASHGGTILTADRRFIAYVGASGRTVEAMDLEDGSHKVLDAVQDPLTFIDPDGEAPDISLPFESVNIIGYTLYDASVKGGDGRFVLERRTIDLESVFSQDLADPFDELSPVLP